jgi:hypothetical protein
MKYRNYIFLFIVLVLLFSCDKKKENNNENVQKETEQASIEKITIENKENRNNVLNGLATEKEAMKEFLYKNDEFFKKYYSSIVYIEKVNFGIPGGENWIVRLYNSGITIYAINGELIEKRYYLTSFDLDDESEFNIMQDIPGTRIDSSTSSFGDFNGDGIDEMFEYGFYGYRHEIRIRGYDTTQDNFVLYCGIPFKIIDSKNGPAPVEFTTYNGMYGFKVYYSNPEVAGGLGWVPNPDPKNYTWRFYTWDAEQRKYIEIGVVNE